MSLVSLAEYERAKTDNALFRRKVETITQQRENLLKEKSLAVISRDSQRSAEIDRQFSSLGVQLNAAAEGQISTQEVMTVFENQTTIPSASDTTRSQKYQDSAGYNTETAQLPDLPDYARSQYNTNFQPFSNLVSGKRDVPGVAPGAQRPNTEPTNFIFKDVTGKKLGEDLRVKIRVPSSYLTAITKGIGNELSAIGGIIFPYTPQVSFDVGADYASMSPLHSNFAINFYQRSKIGEIQIGGKFTVENSKEAAIYIATTHLLRSLTRMRSGGLTGDSDSGSPPPVCRLDAYGEMVLKNVPVAIKSVRIELPEGIDYFTFKGANGYGPTSVPILSTISVTCIPMYSRNEMQKFSVSGYLASSQAKKQGFV